MKFDLIVVGGGLAGCAFISALKETQPRLQILLVEKAAKLGGNHTWCLHDADIPTSLKPWFLKLVSKSWPTHQVYFPEHERQIPSAYHALRSEDLHESLTKTLEPSELALATECIEERRDPESGQWRLRLRSQAREYEVYAPLIFHARGWTPQNEGQRQGWQKFVGMEVELSAPHGLEQVILMDARIPQVDGYRFIYILPWDSHRLLIEDTYYSNHPMLKSERIQREILAFIEAKAWTIKKVERVEEGCLPLTMDMQTPRIDPELPIPLGAHSGYFNPVTGYTLPYTLRSIEALVGLTALTQESASRALQTLYNQDRPHLRYLNMLNRMMFLAAKNEERFRILQRFYRLPLSTITNFYSGRLSRWDKARILIGKPPVSLIPAIKAVLQRPTI